MEKLDTPPLLSINFLATGNLLKHSTERFPYEFFWHCETKNFLRKILILPPPPSYSNFFGSRNQCNSKGFPYGNFRHCETEKFRRKILILPPPLSINSFATGNFWSRAEKGSRAKFFGTVRQKLFVGKSWHSLPPPPHHSKINFFATGNLLKHSTEGFLYELFRYCKTKNFWQKILT